MKRRYEEDDEDNEVGKESIDADDESDDENEDYDEEDDNDNDRSDRNRKSSSQSGADVPLFERLQRLQQEQEEESFANVVSSRKMKKMAKKSFGEADSESRKSNKHGPAIMRSDRPVKRLRDTNSTTSTKAFRDPRFSDACGSLNEDKFHQSFNFLEGYQESEINVLKRALKKAKGGQKAAAIQEELHQRQQQYLERRRALAVKEKLHSLRAEEMAKVKDGKKPFFLKESAKKQIALEEKYEELKKSGKLHKYMEKKRKKNAAKDHRWMPETRRSAEF